MPTVNALTPALVIPDTLPADSPQTRGNFFCYLYYIFLLKLIAVYLSGFQRLSRRPWWALRGWPRLVQGRAHRLRPLRTSHRGSPGSPLGTSPEPWQPV